MAWIVRAATNCGFILAPLDGSLGVYGTGSLRSAAVCFGLEMRRMQSFVHGEPHLTSGKG